MILACVCCDVSDARTNAGGLFCLSCHANASEMGKDLLFGAYIDRMVADEDMDGWKEAA